MKGEGLLCVGVHPGAEMAQSAPEEFEKFEFYVISQ